MIYHLSDSASSFSTTTQHHLVPISALIYNVHRFVSGIATDTASVPAHAFYPPPQPYHQAYGGGGISTTTSDSPANYPQQQKLPSSSYVTTQPILQPQNAPLNYGSMMGGAAPIQATIYAVPPPPPPQNTTTTHHHIIVDDIRLVGGCPMCRIGMLEDNFPCPAVCCAILFFPIGVLCCLAMRNKRCSHCSYEF